MTQTLSSTLLVPNEVAPEQFVSAEHSIKIALGGGSQAKRLRAIWLGAGGLGDVTARLARTISHHFPTQDGQGGLLAFAIASAGDAYVASTAVSQRMEDHEQAYLIALHRAVWQVNAHDVVALWETGEAKMWRPFQQPLVDWVKKVRPDRVGFMPTDRQWSSTEKKASAAVMAAYLFGMERAEAICAVLDEANAR